MQHTGDGVILLKMLARSFCSRVVTLNSTSKSCKKLSRQHFIRGLSSEPNQKASENVFIRYLRTLKWTPIPLGVGFAYIGYQQYGHVRKRESKKTAADPGEGVAKEWQVKLYRALPLKVMSRLWGKVNSLELPVFMREPLYKLYGRSFGVNIDEAAIRDYKHYRNLGEFFRRRLKPGCRPVDKNSPVTSPSDGKILHFGKIENGQVEQVKGITYELSTFIGSYSWQPFDNDKAPAPTDDKAYHKSLLSNKDNELYHAVIYLAPGDYHGFHSPVDWLVSYRKHFPGDLLSVNPGIARWIKGLFNLNERAVYLGQWEHGFFCMAAVGATNVGSIKIFSDKHLETNLPHKFPEGVSLDVDFKIFSPKNKGIQYNKGEPFGEFRLGSTIVLVFEAPKDFKFNLSAGQSIKYGNSLGKLESEKGSSSVGG